MSSVTGAAETRQFGPGGVIFDGWVVPLAVALRRLLVDARSSRTLLEDLLSW
jgi:hypothetical protein